MIETFVGLQPAFVVRRHACDYDSSSVLIAYTSWQQMSTKLCCLA